MSAERPCTRSQVIALQQIWGRVAKSRGWKSGDRERRMAVLSDCAGRPLESSAEIGRMDEFTRVKHRLEAMLGESVQAGLEADDPWPNRRRVMLHQIVSVMVPCLERYGVEVVPFVRALVRDKGGAWGLGMEWSEVHLTDLPIEPLRRVDGGVSPGPLTQIRDTLARCLDRRRQERGESVHEMHAGAGVPCPCAGCRRASKGG